MQPERSTAAQFQPLERRSDAAGTTSPGRAVPGTEHRRMIFDSRSRAVSNSGSQPEGSASGMFPPNVPRRRQSRFLGGDMRIHQHSDGTYLEGSCGILGRAVGVAPETRWNHSAPRLGSAGSAPGRYGAVGHPGSLFDVPSIFCGDSLAGQSLWNPRPCATWGGAVVGSPSPLPLVARMVPAGPLRLGRAATMDHGLRAACGGGVSAVGPGPVVLHAERRCARCVAAGPRFGAAVPSVRRAHPGRAPRHQAKGSDPSTARRRAAGGLLRTGVMAGAGAGRRRGESPSTGCDRGFSLGPSSAPLTSQPEATTPVKPRRRAGMIMVDSQVNRLRRHRDAAGSEQGRTA